MDQKEFLEKLARQKAWFAAGNTRPVSARLDALRRLKTAILEMEDKINAALRADLGKSA